MKYAVSFLCLLFLVACQPKSLPTVVEIDENGAVVKMSHETTQTELDSIIRVMAEVHGAEITYANSRFFENGRLRDLELEVSLPSGSTGKAAAMLATLEYNYFGFTYTKSSGHFVIGSLK